MKLIVIRHAATEANGQGIINGQYDEDISQEGRQEIPNLVNKLRNCKFDAIYVSPLKRTMETALPIAKDHRLKINQDERLIEVNAGQFTRQSYKATIEAFGMTSPELLNTYTYDMTPYGGESAQQVQQRISSFIDYLKVEPYQNVLIVTHGGIIRWFYYICNQEKVKSSPNLSLHEFNV